MTHHNTYIPIQHSRVEGLIIGTLTVAMIVMAGFLSLVQFAVVV